MDKLFRSSVKITPIHSIINGIGICGFGWNSYCYGTAYDPITSNFNNTTITIPSAESVHQSESMKLPPSVGSFIILIANEAHESWQDEKHKLITDKNSFYIPKNLRTNILIDNKKYVRLEPV